MWVVTSKNLRRSTSPGVPDRSHGLNLKMVKQSCCVRRGIPERKCALKLGQAAIALIERDAMKAIQLRLQRCPELQRQRGAIEKKKGSFSFNVSDFVVQGHIGAEREHYKSMVAKGSMRESATAAVRCPLPDM